MALKNSLPCIAVFLFTTLTFLSAQEIINPPGGGGGGGGSLPSGTGVVGVSSGVGVLATADGTSAPNYAAAPGQATVTPSAGVATYGSVAGVNLILVGQSGTPPVLTGNIGSSVCPANGTVDKPIMVVMRQDGTGGRTNVWPSCFNNPPTIASEANAVTITQFTLNSQGTYDENWSVNTSGHSIQILGAAPVSPPGVGGLYCWPDTTRATMACENNGGVITTLPNVAAGGTLQTTGAFTINLTCAGNCTPTFPSASDTVVELTQTQTLTGKTLTSPVLNGATAAGTIDLSGAAHTLPALVGSIASLPATCTVGEVYFATNATAGQNWYFCTSTNSWTQQLNSGGSGGGSPGSTYFTYVNATGVGPSNTAAETSLIGTATTGSKTIPANTFVAGALSEFRISGQITTPTVPDNLTLNMYMGATKIATGTITGTNIASLTTQSFSMKVPVFMVSGGATCAALVEDMSLVSGALVGGAIVKFQGTASTFDCTATQAFDFKAQWANAQAGESVFGQGVGLYTPGAPVTGVLGRIGNVTAQSGDYTCAQVTNCPTLPTILTAIPGIGSSDVLNCSTTPNITTQFVPWATTRTLPAFTQTAGAGFYLNVVGTITTTGTSDGLQVQVLSGATPIFTSTGAQNLATSQAGRSFHMRFPITSYDVGSSGHVQVEIDGYDPWSGVSQAIYNSLAPVVINTTSSSTLSVALKCQNNQAEILTLTQIWLEKFL